uniref:Leucine rich repeat containing 43 n=1 Tax=Xiphophorus couchianus TaxID=32473 RepID=A0A3B5KSC3_9TELE
MSSKTLSAAIEKNIRRLGLTDFPCGNGPWVSFHCPRRAKNGPDEAETESPDVLLDLLRYPRSPWMYSETWSPQASELRELAVKEPKRLSKNFILNYFTTIRITGKNVSSIDKGLLKFSKLEELVLSGNLISEIPAKHLPSTLKILELRANRLSSLSDLASCPPPQLQYLGLGSNSLGSHQDICDLTGRHWPHLACLDLSNCNFQEQQFLVATLETLPCLKTLTLKGNPFTMTPSYPGFTVDSLPQISCLDSSWLTTEERYNFFGLARMNDLVEDVASVTLSLTRLRGIPDPLMHVDKKAVEFPIVTYKYFISYQFFSHPTPGYQCSVLLLVSIINLFDKNSCFSNKYKFIYEMLFLTKENVQVDGVKIENMTSSFCSVLKVKTPPKPKNKKKKGPPELVHDPPIRKLLNSVHVPMQSLVDGGQRVNTVCDFGPLQVEPPPKQEEASFSCIVH